MCIHSDFSYTQSICMQVESVATKIWADSLCLCCSVLAFYTHIKWLTAYDPLDGGCYCASRIIWQLFIPAVSKGIFSNSCTSSQFSTCQSELWLMKRNHTRRETREYVNLFSFWWSCQFSWGCFLSASRRVQQCGDVEAGDAVCHS